MKRFGISLVVVMTVASLFMEGQSQAAPAPGAPIKAVDLAQAAAPAKKVDYPTPGRSVNVIVPYAAGGGTGGAAQMLASLLEKELKTPFQVVFRPGAGAQVGTTELVRSKPDGYTIGYAGVPTTPVIYLDPQRQAVFNRSSFTHIASHFATSALVSVPATSPYKTLKDLVHAAKAQPEKITVATIGLNSPAHLGGMMLEKAAGVKFAFVHFDAGDAPATNAVLGGT